VVLHCESASTHDKFEPFGLHIEFEDDFWESLSPIFSGCRSCHRFFGARISRRCSIARENSGILRPVVGPGDVYRAAVLVNHQAVGTVFAPSSFLVRRNMSAGGPLAGFCGHLLRFSAMALDLVHDHHGGRDRIFRSYRLPSIRRATTSAHRATP